MTQNEKLIPTPRYGIKIKMNYEYPAARRPTEWECLLLRIYNYPYQYAAPPSPPPTPPPTPAKNPTECLAQLGSSNKMTDLTIIIPGHNHHIRAHRLILSMWSSVFEAMLFGPMAECDTITLKEDPPQAFEWVLNYMYTGEKTLTSVELALQVYLLADKYNMKHLLTVCSQSLIIQVTAVSVPQILNIATLLDDKMLINKCAEVIGVYPDYVFSSPTIGSFNIDALMLLLSKDLPVSSESVVFKGIINWCRNHLESQGKEITSITLRQEVEVFLPVVRFLSMSLEEFVKNVLPEKILTFKEVEAIQLNIAGVPEVCLPPLFSTVKISRGKFNMSLLHKCRIVNKKNRGVNLKKNYYTSSLFLKSSDWQIQNPTVLSEIKTAEPIFLDKVEYEKNIGIIGRLTLKTSSGQKRHSVNFDGQVAKFKRLKMQPGETYRFTIMGAKARKGVVCPNLLSSIENNDLISGDMVNVVDVPCVFHYWK